MSNFSHLHIWTTAIYFQPNEHINEQIVWYLRDHEIQTPIYRNSKSRATGIQLRDLDGDHCTIEYLGDLWQFELIAHTDRGNYRYSGRRINHDAGSTHYPRHTDIIGAYQQQQDYTGLDEAYRPQPLTWQERAQAISSARTGDLGTAIKIGSK
jgi:hypothetical protein